MSQIKNNQTGMGVCHGQSEAMERRNWTLLCTRAGQSCTENDPFLNYVGKLLPKISFVIFAFCLCAPSLPSFDFFSGEEKEGKDQRLTEKPMKKKKVKNVGKKYLNVSNNFRVGAGGEEQWSVSNLEKLKWLQNFQRNSLYFGRLQSTLEKLHP